MYNDVEIKEYVENLVYNESNDNLDMKSIQKLVRVKYGMSKLKFKNYLKENNIIRSAEVTNQIKSINLQKAIELNPEIIEKRHQTNLEKYGDRNYNNSKKAKQTLLAKYGVENVYQLERVKEKIKQTKLEKYNDPNYVNIEKAKQTNLEKYGVEYTLQSEYVRNKGKQTILEKYGVENVYQSEEIKNKIKQIKLEKYDDPYYNNSEKVKQTNLERYGAEYAIQSKSVRDKICNTNIEKFGCISPFGSKEVQEKSRHAINEKYGVSNAMQNQDIKDKAQNTSLDKYNVPYNCMTPQCIDANGYKISKVNKLFKEQLDTLEIKAELEYIVDKYSYDFHIIDTNILIEINPTVTHNTEISIFKRKPIDFNYHKIKSDVASKNRYNCIHIFDWDDKDKIIKLLEPKQNLYARKLEVKEITEKDTNIFLNTYHLQNTCKGQVVRLGLYNKDELVQIMTFGKPRYNKRYAWELLRLCTKFNYTVVGGSEKLFKYFVTNYNPKSIISYCDLSKFSGDVYKKLEFKLNNITNPAKHWSKKNKQITDNLLRQRGYDQLFKANYGKGTSNEQLMLDNGWLPVYDCGQAVYIWKIQK